MWHATRVVVWRATRVVVWRWDLLVEKDQPFPRRL